MDTKLKYILIGLVAVCIVSVFFNIVLCSRNNATPTVAEPVENNSHATDSIKIAELQDSIRAYQENARETTAQISMFDALVKRLRQDSTNLQSTQNEYRNEIHRLITEIDSVVKNGLPANKISVKQKYRKIKK